MNLKKICFQPQNRRGLSSVVGALFFTVLMIAGFSVLSLALDAQTDIVTTQRIVSDIEIKKQQEQFGIIASTDVNDHLNVSINNQGQNPVEISSIWITNKTLPDQPTKRYTVNYDTAFIPSGFTSDVVSTQVLEMIPDTYDIKVVSSFGSIKTVELDMTGGGTSGLRAEMVTDPPDVIIGQNVTIAMLVTNTGTIPITNVIPNALGYASSGTIISPVTSPPTPASANLDRGESVLFTWDYLVTGDSADELTFSSSATGDGPIISNPVSDISILREPTDGGSGSGGEGEVIVGDELFGKPQIFMIFPNPVGWDDNDEALWGVLVANPTDQPIDVSKVVIVAISPRATSSDKIFAPECGKPLGSPLDPITVSPTTDRWSCPEANQLQWKDTLAPQTIQPRSVFPFLVKIGTDSIGSATGEANNIPIHTTVFTTLGQFGKTGYMSTMADKKVSMPNVFLSTAVGTANPANIIGTITGIVEGTSVTFNASIADMDEDSSNAIKLGSRLIINVPQEWTNVVINSHGGFPFPVVNNYPDGSTQIIGTLTAELDGTGQVARTIQFTATAPDVTTAKMYVMHILAEGTAEGELSSEFTIGPISETVLQVCDSSGCP